jgi:hypothetical protein
MINFKYMVNIMDYKKKTLSTLSGVLLGFCALTSVAHAETDLAVVAPKATIGVGFDVSYLAPVLEVGYRVHDYVGVRVGVQYTLSSDMSNIIAERKLASDLGETLTKRWKYSNFAVPLTLDIYPMMNSIRVSVGGGYMERKYEDKIATNGSTLTALSKWFVTAGVGYQGYFVEDSSIGYNVDVKAVIIKDGIDKKYKQDLRVNPTAVFGVNYSL